MLPNKIFVNTNEGNKTSDLITLEAYGPYQFQLLATNLTTLERTSMEVFDCRHAYNMCHFRKPSTQYGGLIAVFSKGTDCSGYPFFIGVSPDGEINLSQHWRAKGGLLYSVSRNKCGEFCLKVMSYEHTYVSDERFAEGGEYVVSDTTMLCKFLVGEIDEETLKEAAEKEAASASSVVALQDKVNRLEFAISVNEGQYQELLNRLQTEHILAQKAYATACFILQRHFSNPWGKRNNLVKARLVALLDELENIPTVKGSASR